MTLVLRQVLDHPVLQPASPVLLSGEDFVDHAVRWVHTADLYDIAPLLRGDEILLTNGVGLVGVDESAAARHKCAHVTLLTINVASACDRSPAAATDVMS